MKKYGFKTLIRNNFQATFVNFPKPCKCLKLDTCGRGMENGNRTMVFEVIENYSLLHALVSPISKFVMLDKDCLT